LDDDCVTSAGRFENNVSLIAVMAREPIKFKDANLGGKNPETKTIEYPSAKIF
jgi:hypothetical protein